MIESDQPSYVRCDLCGEDDYEVLCKPMTTDGPVVRCRVCGLIYVNPRNSGFIYDSSTNSKSKWEEYINRVKRFHLISPEHAKNSEQTQRIYLEDRLTKVCSLADHGRLLDVGCAAGTFLDMARDRGFDVFGVEPTPYTAEAARTKHGLNVFPGTLEEARFDQSSFDVVTLFHVIEHTPSPRKLLLEIHRVLRPGGLICLETPCVDNLWFHLMGRNWRQYIPDHYYFFSKQTLIHLFRISGFDVLEVNAVGKRLPFDMLLARTYRYWPFLGRYGPIISRRLLFGTRTVNLNLGDIVLAFARRKQN